MMMSKYKGAVCTFAKYVQSNQLLIPSPVNCLYYDFQQNRNMSKHWNPKFRSLRAKKFIKVELPKFDTDDGELSREKIRVTMKKAGIIPSRTWRERPLLVTSTSSIIEPYIVPEGDGKYSTITKEGAKQKIDFLGHKGKSILAIRKIKSFEEEFSRSTFLEQALEIYKKAHIALANKNKDELAQYVTEFAYPLMLHNVEDKTIVWKFLESLEPARIVHSRCAEIIVKTNLFAQITVRFHTQQMLCIYDRFGRQMKGSEILRKDVLEYVVFEKHLSNVYGTWRLHAKIIPSWSVPGEAASKTYTIPKKIEEKTSLLAKDSEVSVAGITQQ